MRILANSIFFEQIYNSVKSKNISNENEIDIFKQAKTQLKLLFDLNNWNEKIHESILHECFKRLKKEKNLKIVVKEELKDLIWIFQKENFDYLKADILKNYFIISFQKEEINLTAKSCINIIDGFEAIQTDFYEELNKIIKGIQGNITPNEIENYVW